MIQTDEEIKKEEWSEKDYLANLHFLIGDRTENQWILILGIIQGKINYEKDTLQEEYKKELIEKIKVEPVQLPNQPLGHEAIEVIMDFKKKIINIIKQ